MISGYNTNSRTKLYLPCPKCGKGAEISLPHFIAAINLEEQFVCIDCHTAFVIKVTCLTRPPELRNEAEQRYGDNPVKKTLVLENGEEAPICDDMDHEISFDCGYRYCPYCGVALRPVFSADV